MDKPLSQQQLNQARLRKIVKYSAITLIFFALFGVLMGSLASSIKLSEVRTAQVVREDLKMSLSAGGVIVPVFEETIASNIDSHLIKVLVQAGQTVETGQVLMQLDTNKVLLELANMDEEISLKKNKIKTRKLDLNKSTNDLKGRLELLSVDLDSRKTRFDRMRQLAATGGTSRHELKEAELNVKRTQIEIRLLQQTIRDNEASTVAEIEGFKLEQSILEQSRNEKLRLFESATVKANRNGLISWIKNAEGSAISIGESLIKISDPTAYKLEATISDFYANQLWQGMPAEFDYDQSHYSGKLQSIIAGEQQGILLLTIKLDTAAQSDPSELRQKQRVDVALITGEEKNALVIAKGPFIKGAGIQNVFVINQHQAHRTEVKIGSGNRDYYQIKRGLNEGDRVIISDVTAIAHLDQIDIN